MEQQNLERAARSESIAQVAAALAAAQGEFPTIPRDRTVTIQPKPKRRQDGTEYWPQPYSYTYAPLPTILEKVRPAMAKNGLALTQSVVVVNDKGHEAVRTMLLHSSGEFLANETPLFVAGSDNASQGYASGMTYARRYGVTALLCIAADDDDDAEAAGDAEPQRLNAGRKPQGKAAPATPQAKAKAPPQDQQQGPATPLSAGPQRLLEAKAKAAGLTLEEVAQRFGEVTMANLNDTLTALTELANGGA